MVQNLTSDNKNFRVRFFNFIFVKYYFRFKMEVDYTWVTSSNNVPVQKLEQHFRESFESVSPEYYIKVPGRVNLIGEHVDYCGYSVFPMAIDQCIVVAAKRTTDRHTVELTNLCTERYENVSKNISDIK